MRRAISTTMLSLWQLSLEPRLVRQALLVFAANLQHLCCGLGIGLSSPCLGQLALETFTNPDNLPWFASSLIVGQVVGSLLGPVLADALGRRRSCMLAALGSASGWALLGLAQSELTLFVGRALTGLFDCLAVPVAIMYVSEISETSLKGSFINSSAIASGLGIAVAYLLGTLLYWRYVCAFPILFSAMVIFIMSFCPESPVYLISKSQSAEESLMWFRATSNKEKNKETQVELKEMESNASPSEQGGLQKTLGKLRENQNLKPFVILIFLFFLYPLTGVYSITFFAINLFKTLNLGSPETVAIISALMHCFGTSLTSLLIYKYGRRKIMLVSSSLSVITLGLVGAFLVLKDSNLDLLNADVLLWCLIVLIFLFMFICGVSIVNLPWVLMGEWFVPELKSLVSMILITLQFFFIFVAVQTTDVIIDLIGNSGFFIYSCAICAVNTVFIAIYVPETNGKLYHNR